MILAVEMLEEKEERRERYRIRLKPEGKRTVVMTHEEKRLVGVTMWRGKVTQNRMNAVVPALFEGFSPTVKNVNNTDDGVLVINWIIFAFTAFRTVNY